MDEHRDYLSPTEAAAALGLTRRAVVWRLATGLMAGERIGARGWLVSRAEVERWQALGKQKPGPKPRHARPRRGPVDDAPYLQP